MPLNAETVARLTAWATQSDNRSNREVLAHDGVISPEVAEARAHTADLRAVLTTLAQVAIVAKTQKVMNPDQPNPIYDMFDPAMRPALEPGEQGGG